MPEVLLLLLSVNGSVYTVNKKHLSQGGTLSENIPEVLLPLLLPVNGSVYTVKKTSQSGIHCPKICLRCCCCCCSRSTGPCTLLKNISIRYTLSENMPEMLLLLLRSEGLCTLVVLANIKIRNTLSKNMSEVSFLLFVKGLHTLHVKEQQSKEHCPKICLKRLLLHPDKTRCTV
jgi:hypothetical protein